MSDEARTLYVNRRLLNAADIKSWARAQGFDKTLPAEDVHVTVAFSKTPVKWDAAGAAADGLSVRDQGQRSVDKLGDKGAVVLRFESSDLSERWKEFMNVGASWDWPEYKPHVTITYEGGSVDLSAVEPYAGPLEFGPEIFGEVDEGWADKVKAAMDGMHVNVIAFDRSSVRSYDRDGRLHVATTNISKAAVNPYLGREIPDWERLGLEPTKLYKLFRDPEEVEKAAPTFNNLPLLSRHVAVTADAHAPELVIGSTGTDAEFSAPYLRNSLVIWAKGGIDAVESSAQKQLSSAYRYRADMTPGVFEGEKYDGVMRDIVGNHVAIVPEGRAGADVVVGDSNQEIKMAKMTKKILMSGTACAVLGALTVALAPKLAMDAKVDLRPLVQDLTAKNFKEKKPALLTALASHLEGKLAKDATIDDVTEVLDALQTAPVLEAVAEVAANDPLKDGEDPNKKADATDDDPLAKIKAFLAGKISDEDMAQLDAMMMAGAADEPPPFPGKPKVGGAKDKDMADKDKKDDDKDVVKKPAMDAAIALAVKTTADSVIKTQREIRDAERAVRPYVGELNVAFDSAEQVYRAALTGMGVKVDGVHASALKTILEMQPKPGSAPKTPKLGMDAAAHSDFAKRYPGASKIAVL